MGRVNAVGWLGALAVLAAGCAVQVPAAAPPQATATRAHPGASAHRSAQPGPSAGRSRSKKPSERGIVLRRFVAVDGDTIASGGVRVRVIGLDTPEVGQCGYDRAKAFTARFISGGVTLVDRQGRDRYGRILASVRNSDGRDLGTALLRRGLANARYDSTDGYEWHPLQDRYERLDKRVKHVCGRGVDTIAGPEVWRGGTRPFPDCVTAEQAGAAPLRRSDPRFNPDLDGDGDGVACE